MAYQALYRKYRPQTFDDVAGQKHIIQTLKNAADSDRVAHAYLFCGPRGTGKTSVAKIFAKLLNCTGDGNKPCGTCPNCLESPHPDIIEMDAASNNGVDEVRDLIDRVKYAPMLGQYKIYIIDEVHMMTPGAFNALLKTIEEPPAHVVFILATTEPNKVLPTIISRCQRFDFKRVPDQEIQARLLYVADKEHLKLDEDAAAMIASLSQGGLRDALSILDQCAAYTDEITAKDVRDVYGVVSQKDIAQMFSKLTAKDVEGVMEGIEEVAANGMDLKRFTQDFITLLKDSLILEYSPDSPLLCEEEKKLLQAHFMDSPLSYRSILMNGLMEISRKFAYASNVTDYVEAALLLSLEDLQSSPQTLNSYVQPSEKSKSMNFSHEIPSEKGDKSEITRQKVTKSVKITPPEISDVSRETFSENLNEKKDGQRTCHSNEYLLGLLAAASKKERQEDEKKLKSHMPLLSPLEYGRFIALLQNGKIIASADEYLIVQMSDSLESEAVNRLQEEIGFEKFCLELLGKPKAVFAADSTQTKEVLQEFRSRMKDGTLPEKPPISIRSIEVHSESLEESLREYFPSMKVTED
jgi:DNA polymerase-3 subunit gamma/tau